MSPLLRPVVMVLWYFTSLNSMGSAFLMKQSSIVRSVEAIQVTSIVEPGRSDASHPRHHMTVTRAPQTTTTTTTTLSTTPQSNIKWPPIQKSLPVSVMILFWSLQFFGISPAAYAIDNPFVYSNDYADPFHPLCERRIVVAPDGRTFQYSGTAVGPKDDPVRRGCSPEEIEKYQLRRGAFTGFILDNGKRISAGDGIHEGYWEPAGSLKTRTLGYEDVDGIRWNDGNKWVVIKK